MVSPQSSSMIHLCSKRRIVSYSTRVLLFQQMLADRLLSLDKCQYVFIDTERLAYSDSNAKLIEAMFERRVMVGGFLVAYTPILSISAQSLERRSVLISSFTGGEYRLWPAYQHLYSLFVDPLNLGCANLLPSLSHSFVVLCGPSIGHCSNQTSD